MLFRSDITFTGHQYNTSPETSQCCGSEHDTSMPSNNSHHILIQYQSTDIILPLNLSVFTSDTIPVHTVPVFIVLPQVPLLDLIRILSD